ncbi:MAG: transcriptional regulator, partial [Anaerolineae bacterium]|nr:transcriptional regulator [Anaerolineae bacterium]
DAEVIEAATRVPVTADLDAGDLEIKGEYTRFLERTRLDEVRPDQRIEFTIGGGYERLLEHIAVHRYFMGLEQQRFIPEDEAVCDWYDHVYLPLVHIICEKGILADFPGRTETDLYLWTMDHQHYLRERFGPGVGTEQATEHFADHYTTRPIKRMVHAVQDLVAGQDDGEIFATDTPEGERAK